MDPGGIHPTPPENPSRGCKNHVWLGAPFPPAPQRDAGTARRQAELHSPAPATSISRIPGWGGVEARRALGGTQGAHGQCCLPIPQPAPPAAPSLPPSGGSTTTLQPTPAPGPGTDGHGAVAKVSLLMAPGCGRQLICTSQPARQPRLTGTCRRRRAPRGCIRRPGARPVPPGSTATAAARQKGAQHHCYGSQPPSPLPRPSSPVPCPQSPACLEVDGVNTQVVGVQVAELGQGLAEVVQALDGVAQGVRHFLAVAADLVGARAQVEVGEVGLGLGVGDEHPAGAGQSVLLTPSRTPHTSPPWGSHPLAPLARGVPGLSLHLSRASAPKSSWWPTTFSQICWISFLSSAVSMAAAGGGGQVLVAVAPAGTPSYSSQHLRPGLILSAPRGGGATAAQRRAQGAAAALPWGAPTALGGPDPRRPRGGPAALLCPAPLHQPHTRLGAGGSTRPGCPMVNSSHGHTSWVPQPWPHWPAHPQASCWDPPFPLAGPGSSLAPRVSGWVPHMSLAPHVLQPLVHPAPLCQKSPWASEQEPWTSPPGSCWGSAMRNTISPAARKNLGGEEPPFWVHGLPKVHPVMLVRPGLLPFFPPQCVLLPLPVNAGTSHRVYDGW